MRQCSVHKHRDEVPLDAHHVWPLSEGGPDEKWNLIDVCPNGHREIHEFLRLLKKYDGHVPWIKRRKYGKKTRDVAIRGWLHIVFARDNLA